MRLIGQPEVTLINEKELPRRKPLFVCLWFDIYIVLKHLLPGLVDELDTDQDADPAEAAGTEPVSEA